MLYILLLFVINIGIYAQDSLMTTDEPIRVLSDYYYKFYPGDTITYRVSSRDSIVIEFGKALTKDRYEIYEVVCDSVGKKNKYFYLTYTLKNYIADEVYSNTEKARRTSSPWINRNVHLVIDSTGKRIRSFVNDPNIFSMSPGGAFSPYLFMEFREIYKVNNESWIVSSYDTLAENGVPYPIIKQSTLYRSQLPVDTLGYSTYSANYIRTATGNVITLSNDAKIIVEAVTNLGGTIYLSREDHIPVIMLATQEQKLKITTPDKEAMPGFHYNSVVYELDSFKPSKFRNQKETDLKNTKTKKHTKKS